MRTKKIFTKRFNYGTEKLNNKNKKTIQEN